MSTDLGKIVEALAFARRANTISRHALLFSLALIAVLVPAALSSVIGVATAEIVHEVGDLIAFANGVRAARA